MPILAFTATGSHVAPFAFLPIHILFHFFHARFDTTDYYKTGHKFDHIALKPVRQ